MWTLGTCCWRSPVALAKSLEDNLGEAGGLRGLLQGAARLLMTEIELEASTEFMGVGVSAIQTVS